MCIQISLRLLQKAFSHTAPPTNSITVYMREALLR